MNKEEATMILDKLEYPTADTIKAFAVKYPLLFERILRDMELEVCLKHH